MGSSDQRITKGPYKVLNIGEVIYLSTSVFPIEFKAVSPLLFPQSVGLELPSWKLWNSPIPFSALTSRKLRILTCLFIVILLLGLAFSKLSNQVIDVKVICIRKVLERHYCYGSCYVLGREFKFRPVFLKIIIWFQVSKCSIKKEIPGPNELWKNVFKLPETYPAGWYIKAPRSTLYTLCLEQSYLIYFRNHFSHKLYFPDYNLEVAEIFGIGAFPTLPYNLFPHLMTIVLLYKIFINRDRIQVLNTFYKYWMLWFLKCLTI